MKTTIKNKILINNIKEAALGLLYPRTCPVCGKRTGDVYINDSVVKILKEQITDPAADPSPSENPGARNKSSTSSDSESQHLRQPAGNHSRQPSVKLHRQIRALPPHPVPLYICPDCYSKLDFAEGKPRCIRCSRPVDSESDAYCRDCSSKERRFDRGYAVMMHNVPARKILYDLKYMNMRQHADFLGFEAAMRQGRNIAMFRPDVIIPVPLHKKRLMKRGYNQAALIAQRFVFYMELAGVTGLKIDEDYLIRTGSTSPLKEMNGQERMTSLNGAFAVRRLEPGYKRILIIDDIFTTGATLNECSKILRQSGADVVYFLTASIGS